MEVCERLLAEFEKDTLFVQELPCMLHTVNYVGVSATQYINKYFPGASGKIIEIFVENYIYYIYSHEELIKTSQGVVKNRLKDPQYFNQLIEQWKKLVNHFYGICKKLDNLNLSQLSLEELEKTYSGFKEAYLEEYAPALITDYTGFHGEIELLKELERITSGESSKFKEYLTILTAAINDSFLGREQFELYKLVLELENLESEEAKNIIEKHREKYYWIQNNYIRTEELGFEYFFNRIKNHSKDKEIVKKFVDSYYSGFEENKKKKEALLNEMNASEEFRIIIEMIDSHGYWQDMRKEANLHADHYIEKFLREVSRRLNINYEDLSLTTIAEFSSLLKGEELNWQKIKERKKLTGIIFHPQGECIFTGKVAERMKSSMEEKNFLTGVGDFRGTVANIGKVTGKVSVVLDVKEDEFTEGDILVTSMTRPEFVPLMKKAAAVVTNEGGITCHAAIVARELNMPCIIGTKVATKVLQNGDLVEVNANHGVVRILKKK